MKGEVKKHNERLVTKGFTQYRGVNYHESFARVAWRDTIRVFLAITT